MWQIRSFRSFELQVLHKHRMPPPDCSDLKVNAEPQPDPERQTDDDRGMMTTITVLM